MPIAHKLARYETVHLELTPIDEPVPPPPRPRDAAPCSPPPRHEPSTSVHRALIGVVMRAVLLTLAGPQPGGLVNRAKCARD